MNENQEDQALCIIRPTLRWNRFIYPLQIPDELSSHLSEQEFIDMMKVLNKQSKKTTFCFMITLVSIALTYVLFESLSFGFNIPCLILMFISGFICLTCIVYFIRIGVKRRENLEKCIKQFNEQFKTRGIKFTFIARNGRVRVDCVNNGTFVGQQSGNQALSIQQPPQQFVYIQPPQQYVPQQYAPQQQQYFPQQQQQYFPQQQQQFTPQQQLTPPQQQYIPQQQYAPQQPQQPQQQQFVPQQNAQLYVPNYNYNFANVDQNDNSQNQFNVPLIPIYQKQQNGNNNHNNSLL